MVVDAKAARTVKPKLSSTRRISRGFSKLRYVTPFLKSSKCAQVCKLRYVTPFLKSSKCAQVCKNFLS